MADVEVKYHGSTIGGLSADGSLRLLTGGTYCDDDISVDYKAPSGGSSSTKSWYIRIPTAIQVWGTVVTLVESDPDAAQHHNDILAVVTLTRIPTVIPTIPGIANMVVANYPSVSYPPYNSYGVAVGVSNNDFPFNATVELGRFSSLSQVSAYYPFQTPTSSYGLKLSADGTITLKLGYKADQYLAAGEYKITMDWSTP